jgi:hypothetical protein
VTPIVLIILTISFDFANWCLKRKRGDVTNNPGFKSFKYGMLQMEYFTISIFSFFYPLILNSMLLPYQCKMQNDGSYSLAGSPSENCYSNEWKENITPIYILGFVYVCVFPVVYAIRMVSLQNAQIDSITWKKYSSFTMPYRKGVQFWRLIYLSKKVCLVLTTTLVSYRSDPILSYLHQSWFKFSSSCLM